MIIEGRAFKKQTLERIKEQTETIAVSLAIIQVGDEPESNAYIKNKKQMCLELGFECNHFKLALDIREVDIIALIEELNNDNTTGILIQLPLPKHLDTKKLQNYIDPLKDIDGLTTINMGRLVNEEETLIPCTARAVIELLKKYEIDVVGKEVVVVGKSNLVGTPVAILLSKARATVTICHSRTKDLKAKTSEADILIVAVGKKHLITADMVKEGAVVIDVGINRVDNSKKLYGDVDFNQVKEKAGYITPVPGGVGQGTVAMLAENLYLASQMQKKNKKQGRNLK